MYTDRIKATKQYLEQCEACKVAEELQDYLEEQKSSARAKLEELTAMRNEANKGGYG